jgi:hydroxylamine reductase (hybrid-cluster protein)
MKNFILKFLVSRAGSILTPVIATVVGAIVAKLAAFDSQLASQVDQIAVTGFAVAGILAVVNYLTNAVQTDGVKKIQALVNTPQDGVPGPITYVEVRRALPITSE